ncbi:MAG: hypothetical protein ABR888_04075 [Thermoplasmata archaeon]
MYREHWTRRRRIVVAIGIVAMLLVLYLLATIPLTPRSYSITVVSALLLPSSTALSQRIYANDSGFAVLWVPTGSDVSGSWATADGSVILMLVEYGTSCQSDTNSSGSFHFSGEMPLGPGGTSTMYFDIASSNYVNVTIQGTYTAPLI